MTKKEYLNILYETIKIAGVRIYEDKTLKILEKEELMNTTIDIMSYIKNYEKNKKVYTEKEMDKIEKEDMGRY